MTAAPPGSDPWSQQHWQPRPAPHWSGPPKRSGGPLLVSLIVLSCAFFGVIAVGGFLLLRQNSGREATAGSAQTTAPTRAPGSDLASTTVPEPTTTEPAPPRPPTTKPKPTATKPRPTATKPRPTATKPRPTATKPKPKPSKSPPKERIPTSPYDRHLVSNALYKEKLQPSDCSQAAQPGPTSTAGWKKLVDRVLVCMNAAYKRPVGDAGYRVTMPKAYLYKSVVQTPCGESPAGYAVFYCSGNSTIYATQAALADFSQMRLGLYYALFHEYAHHVQNEVGILNYAYTREEDAYQISRRIELQAECFMGMTLKSVRSAKFGSADHDEIVDWRNQVPDPIHGTSRSQLLWIERGLNTSTFSRCSTWRSRSADVA